MSACLLTDWALMPAVSPSDLAAARRLFQAYAAWLQIDLCFQGFAAELAGLPGPYRPPHGRLLLARVAGDVAGCVALRPLPPLEPPVPEGPSAPEAPAADETPALAEMKRLWVEPGFGGHGLGRRLTVAVISEARAIGYRAIRLDTFPARMPAAHYLYQTLGFREIPPYYHNPYDGVTMLELDLRPPTPSR